MAFEGSLPAIYKWVKPLVIGWCTFFLLTGASDRGRTPQTPLGDFEGQTDVGINPKAGSASFDSAHQEYSVTGGGENIWGTADAFHFVWRPVAADVTLTAYVKLQGTGGNPYRKAGLMVRQGLGPSDAYADAVIHGDGLTSLQCREIAGGPTLEVRSPIAAPQALRLERRGNTFTLFVAGAGQEFKRVGSAAVDLHGPVYAGLAVCSHDVSALETAVFSRVEISSRLSTKTF